MKFYRIIGGDSAPFRCVYFEDYKAALNHAIICCPGDFRLEQFDPVSCRQNSLVPDPRHWSVIIDYLTSKFSES